VALHRAGRTGARKSLGEAWRSERLHWRRAPLALAAARMGDEEARAVLAQDLARGDFPMEMRFFLDLADSDFEELVPALVEGSRLLEEELQLPVAVALLGLGSSAGESRFRDALGGDVEQRLEAIDFLVDLPGEDATALLRKARRGGPEAAQRYAELALVARGEEGPAPALEALDSADRELRQQGVWSLSCYLASGGAGGRGERQARKRLREMLGDPEPVVVFETVRGLGRAGEPSDRGLLAALWAEESPSLSVEVAGAILEIEARDALTELVVLR
jgi:HEAT repeat protein